MHSRNNMSNIIISPRNPNPMKYQQKIQENLKINGPADRPGGILQKPNQSQLAAESIKQKITSVYERHDKVKNQNPQIAPVFGYSPRQMGEVSKSSLGNIDVGAYFGNRISNQQALLYSPKKRPEFTELLSMSRKLDSSVRITKQ